MAFNNWLANLYFLISNLRLQLFCYKAALIVEDDVTTIVESGGRKTTIRISDVSDDNVKVEAIKKVKNQQSIKIEVSCYS
jgi:hypothetical protein